MPVPEYLLAMKCLAARIDGTADEPSDVADIRYLIRYLVLKSAAEVLDVVALYYPANQIPVKTQYLGQARIANCRGSVANDGTPLIKSEWIKWLLFKAGSGGYARMLMNRAIVVTDGGLGAVAPEEAGRSVGVRLVSESLLRSRENVH